MTAMPRMSATPPATAVESIGLGGLIVLALSCFLAARWSWGHLCFLGAMAGFLIFVLRRFISRKTKTAPSPLGGPPAEFVWIPIALLHGILGSLFLMMNTSQTSLSWLLKAGKLMVQQGFVLSIVLGVGGFLAPRLMGTFKIQKAVVPDNPCARQGASGFVRTQWLIHAVGGLLLLSSFFLEAFNFIFLSHGLRAILVSFFLIRSRSWVLKPLLKLQYVKLLWLSMWMVACGCWLVFFFPDQQIALLHLIFIGGYSLMTFAVATMVIYSHAGMPEKLNQHSRGLSITAGCVLVALVLRVGCLFFPEYYFPILAGASLVWILGAVVWFIRMTPLALTSVDPDQLLKFHEEAKRTILQMRQGKHSC